MLMDSLNEFSANAGDDLSSTGTSTNVLDLGDTESIGNELYLHVIPTTAFAGTSVTIILKTSAAANMGSPVSLYTSAALTPAQVNAGVRVRVPAGNLGYMRVDWTTAAGSAGTANIFLSPSVQDTHAVA